MREREIQRETERERERERERELKLAMSFALFLAKNLHLTVLSIGEEFCTFPCQKFAPYFLPSCAEFTLSVAKNVALFETVRILRKIRTTDKWRDRGSKQQNKTIEFPAALSFFSLKKMNQIKTKNYWK